MKLKYISVRVFWTWLLFLLIFVARLIFDLHQLMMERISLVNLLVTIGLFVLFFLGTYFGIYKPYLRSEKMLNRFLDGLELPSFADGSMPILTPSTHHAIRRIDQVLHAPEIFELNKRQAQYLALQNQINPHFLYNTLESIRSEAIIAGLYSVSDMTESLATFFRYTISKVENLVSIEEELENCKTYFHIQQYRFGDRLALHIDYEDGDFDVIRHYKIPKLTLQPILENSIIHGTELKLGTSHLKISFESTEKRVIIRISDDGVGMDEQTLEKLNNKLNRSREFFQEEGSKGGIALANVNNRIHLLFGEEYGMHVYSTVDVGTDVEISIPTIISDREVKNRGVLM